MDGFMEAQIVPYWKLRPVARMANMELKSEFGLLAETKLTRGLEFLMDKFNLRWIRTTKTEVPGYLLEEQALHLKVKDFACRSKGKAKPQRRKLAGCSSSIIPMKERKWIDIEPRESSLSLSVRGFEESNSFSSTFSESTTRRRRSSSILEN